MIIFGQANAKDVYFSKLPEQVKTEITKEWRFALRRGIGKIVKSLPMQIDAVTTIDSAVFVNNKVVYLASVDDESLKAQFELEGEALTADGFWNDEFVMSYMKAHMYKHSKNYVCTDPSLRVHMEIGTISGVEYRYIRDGGHHLFVTEIDDCYGYELKPIQLPNGNRLFP